MSNTPSQTWAKGLLLSLAIIAVPLIFVTGHAHAALTGAESAKVFYNKAEIVNDEQQCSANLNAQNTGGGTKNDPPRTRVDNSIPYAELYWITSLGNPTGQNGEPNGTINVPGNGTANIPMQLNLMQFICAIITKPNSGRTTPLASTLVSNGNFSNNRGPNPDNGDTDSASRYQFRTEIISASISSGPGRLTGVDTGKMITVTRDDTNRYWDSDNTENFTYVPPAGGIKRDTRITIHYRVKKAYTYHANYGQNGAVTTCSNGTDSITLNSLNLGPCHIQDVYVDVLLHVVNTPPHGGITTTCNSDGTGHVAFNFGDVNGNTTARVTINVAGGDPNFVYDYNTSGSYFRDINDVHAGGPWSATIVIQDNGGNSDLTKSDSSPGCNWALASTVTSSVTSALPGQSVPFTLNTKNTGGVKTQNFQYWDSIQYFTGAAGGPKTQFPAVKPTIALNAGASTTQYDSYTVNIPANSNATKVCVSRVTSVTSSANSNPATKTKCVPITQPVCSNWSVTPAVPEPNMKFDISTSVDMKTKAAAQAAMAGSNYFIRIFGPETPADNGPSFFDNENVGGFTISNAGVITANKTDLGPTNTAGVYTLQWGIIGGTAPQNCEKTFDVGYLPFFNVLGGDASAGLTTYRGSNCTQSTNPAYGIIRGQNDTNNWYGSGSQGAALALAQISYFVTSLNPSATPTGGNAYTLPNPASLSFANKGQAAGISNTNPADGSNGGGFGAFGYCANDYAGDAEGRDNAQGVTDPNFDPADPTNDGSGSSGTFTSIGQDITVDASGPLQASQRVSLVVRNADVYIKGSGVSVATAGVTAITSPYFEILVIGGNVYVDPGVTNLYGFYSVEANSSGDGGLFASCSPGFNAETTSYATCGDNPLVIQGALSAVTTHFERGYGTLHGTGGGKTSSTPSESIQFTPEIWLGASNACASDDSFCPTTLVPGYQSITGLPPTL